MVRVGRVRGVGSVAGQVHWCGDDGEAVFAIIDSATVGEDVDVCTFGAKLAVSLRHGSERQ